MIGLLFSTALMAAPGTEARPPVSPPPVLQSTASLHIPDEIAPAVVPYMNCLLASAGIPTYAEGRRVPPPRGIGKGSDCSAVRIRAAREADKMLKRAKGGSPAERAAFIERMLVSMENFRAGPALPPPIPPPTD